MSVRVKLKICIRGKCVVTSALVNSGYEAVEPELAIPLNLAHDLGLWPPDVIIVEEALTAGGSVPIYIIKDKALVSLALNDRFTDNVKCIIVINPYIDEPLISDQLIDALGIIVISFGQGLWRHISDPVDKIRKSSR
ncbi:MAG: hypothetical protein DRO40_03910 [Thermoprotei archaeon]|nr:MAG: hypothetical protein DRO40_03910 [Thermoprotei archaeon]